MGDFRITYLPSPVSCLVSSASQRLPDFVHPTNDKGNALVGFVLRHSRKPVFY